jgi:hypothetical protein
MDNTGFTIPPKLYDFLKFVALVLLPAVATLVLGLGVLLPWTGATSVAGVITLVDSFLGAILGKSASNYKAQDEEVFGELVVKQDQTGAPMGMRIVGLQENPIFQDGGHVVLNVRREVILE